ncbi:hypothetical protein HDU97_001409 [Phlyctochytrium planicorne]|nr:hypothetical protein HDU97_001409 [Phlyctochytrium planicorne]
MEERFVREDDFMSRHPHSWTRHNVALWLHIKKMDPRVIDVILQQPTMEGRDLLALDAYSLTAMQIPDAQAFQVLREIQMLRSDWATTSYAANGATRGRSMTVNANLLPQYTPR